MGKYVDSFNKKIEVVNSGYKKDMLQTFLTSIEWRNVEMAEEYAKHLQEGKIFYNFPYFRQLGEFYRVFVNSYGAARKYNSHAEIIFSDYMVMNVFIFRNN